ncbi:MAG: LysM peptidoglycan-binding domain-containing protein [Chloroflexota bacterium]
MRQRHFYLLFIMLLGLFISQPTNNSLLAQDPASEISQLVNSLRAGFGLAPFQYNGTLAAAAQNHANWMASTAVYSHTQTNGSTPQTRADAVGYGGYVSENIVGGTKLTPSQGVTWWRNSAVHFNTMVSTRYTQMGIGFATGQGQNFYVLVVGNPGGAAPRRTVTQNPAPIAVAPIVLSEPQEDGSIVHQVLDGQTFWAIAARYEVPLTDLFLFNNLTENSLLKPGDSLIIRLAEGQEPPPTPTPPASHVVQEGDTAWSIAAWYNISLDELLWFNNLTEDDFLQPGDEVTIRIPEGAAPPPTATPLTNHVVEAGQSLWEIAARYRISLDELLTWNGLSENTILQPGDELRVIPPPTATAVPSPTPTLAATTETAVSTPMVEEIIPTHTPTVAAVEAITAVQPTPTSPPLPLAASATVNNAPSSLTIALIIFALGLIAFAGVVIFVLQRNS